MKQKYNSLNDFIVSLYPSNNLKKLSTLVDSWVLDQYQCPKCGNYFTNPEDVGFLQEKGLCSGCYEIEGEIESLIQDEANDVKNSWNGGF